MDAPAATAETVRTTELDLDAFCHQWAAWCATRHYYGPPPVNTSPLGRVAKGKAPRTRWPDAGCSAAFAAFYLAYQAQPRALDRRVFELHYLTGVKPIKAAAASVGVSQRHWYTLLEAFRGRVHAASQQILTDNLAARLALAHSHEQETAR